MNGLDKQYLELQKYITEHGNRKADRTGTGTTSVFGWTIRHKMKEGFPLITTKKMAWKQIVTELIWLLRGDTNIKWLVENGNNIWVGDAYKKYVENFKPTLPPPELDVQSDFSLPLDKEVFVKVIKSNAHPEFTKKWGELGPIYGKQWRNWEYGDKKMVKNGLTYPNGEFMYDKVRRHVDQIQEVFDTLKKNPDSRRIMVNAWNVPEIPQMTLPPCHYGFQFYTRELTLSERIEITSKHPRFDVFDFGVGSQVNDESCHLTCDSYGTPKRAISLAWNQRSVDVPLGLPFNIASYGLLLTLVAKKMNMQPDELVGFLGDCHVYTNQEEGVQEQLKREAFELPSVEIHDEAWEEDIDKMILSMKPEDFELVNYQSGAKINFPLSN